MNLETAVRSAINELNATTGYPPHFVNAPHIREIGAKLESALTDSKPVTLRYDVSAFAQKMSDVMGEKEQDKGSAELLPISEPLMRLDFYVQSLKEFGALNNPEQMRRTLIHIANFAMIAESKINVLP